MTRKEFIEWLDTHPTSQWVIMEGDEDHLKVLFWFDEEESIKEEEA